VLEMVVGKILRFAHSTPDGTSVWGLHRQSRPGKWKILGDLALAGIRGKGSRLDRRPIRIRAPKGSSIRFAEWPYGRALVMASSQFTIAACIAIR
jgi:hypothetical protein